MSVESMSWALNLTDKRLTSTDKLILVGIANHDGDGGAWPSMATLARYAGVTVRNAQKSVRKLHELGYIRVENQAGGTAKMRKHERPNLYVVDPPSEATPPVGDDTPPVSEATPAPLSHATPEPSIEPSKNSPARERADAIVKAWWEWHQRQHGTTPTAQSYIAVVKIMERLCKTGRWSDAQLKVALRDAPTISIGALELILNRMGEQGKPAAPQSAKHEPTVWRPDQ